MKSTLTIQGTLCSILITASVVFFCGCSSTPGDAPAYYDRVMDLQQAVFEQEDLFIQTVNRSIQDTTKNVATDDTSNIPYVRVAYIDLCRQIDTSLATLEKLGAFGDDHTLLDATRFLLQKYKALSKNEYQAVVTITEIPRKEYLPEDDEHLQALFKEIDNSLESAIADFSKACVVFAQTHNFKLVEHSDPKP